jgi:uncharacterized protein YraI
MFSRLQPLQGLAQQVRRHWLPLAVAALALAALLSGAPVLAADAQPDVNQTVPPPTPRPPLPPPSDGGDDDGESSSAAPAGPAVTTTASVTSTGTLTAVVEVLALNVRQGPGTTFPVAGKLTQGDAITIEGRNEAGDWWYICCVAPGGDRGWVSASLVTPTFAPEQAAALPIVTGAPAGGTAAGSAPPAPAGAKPGTVAGVNLNVRSGPSTDDPVLGKLRGSDTVAVLGRNENGDWLYVCCVGSPAVNGWASAQFITPAFAAGDLPVVDAAGQPATSTAATSTTEGAGDAAADTVADTAADTVAATVAGALSVAVAQQPPFAVQGREIALVYTVSNAGAEDLTDVVLSSDLPGPLTLVNATAGAGGEVVQAVGDPAVTITWPAVPAGESVTATLRVRVAADVPNGTTFANLATVTAAGGETAGNGITIGMPPALLPEFW